MKTISNFEHDILVSLNYFLDVFKTTLACWENGEAVTDIYDIERDEDDDFYEPDVDETNYDPYLGCDFYDCSCEDYSW